MNKQLSGIRRFAISLVCCAFVFAACTDNEGEDTHLPEGKYPITFTTAVEGLAATRAATADGVWSSGDEIAIKIDDNVKTYTPRDISGNSATLACTTEPVYWQKSDETKNVSGWYYGTGYSNTLHSSWSVNSDQNSNAGEGYQMSDFLYTPQQMITFKPSGGVGNKLPFYHQTARVVINIKNAEDATDASGIQSVNIGNQNNVALSGTYLPPTDVTTVGTWTANGNKGIIIPKEISPASGALKSYVALVIPQNMSGKDFIVVTVNGLSYYYIPKSGDADLKGGNQYTYDITVKQGIGLSVSVNSSLTWTQDGETITGGGTEVTTFNVKIPTVPGLSFTTSGLMGSAPAYTVSANASFSITYTVPSGEDNKGFVVKNGVCDITWVPLENGEYQFTYSNLHSDIELAYDDSDYNVYCNVGDYYNNDGSTSSTYIDGKSIGIVFKKGAGNGDDPKFYDDKLKLATIRGYVVALQDADSDTKQWSTENVSTGASKDLNDFRGYSNTQSIKNKGGESFERYPAAYNCVLYSPVAPVGSSGWYLPSYAQMKTLYDVQGDISSKSGFKALQGVDYWTSTESSDRQIYNIYWPQGSSWTNDKSQSKRIRAVLTF